MANLEKLSDGERIMNITQLIGLGEVQRGIYEYLESHGRLRGSLKKSYLYHQEQLELLIKYKSGMRKNGK